MTERFSKVQQEHNTAYDLADWRAEAKRRFGDDPMDWKFQCPSCKNEIAVRDYNEAGAPEGAVAFSCIGRYLDDAKREAFTDDALDAGPCNYAGGGLFRLNPITITNPDGTKHSVFEFATVVCLGCGGTTCGFAGCDHGKQAGA